MAGDYILAPGASLYYEVVGRGPVLLCISGGDGSVELWKDFAECMSEHFTVVKWDRRGYSRSLLKGSQDYEHRIETDADDAARLLAHLSPYEAATVIGNSSGAMVAMKLLERHPEQIRTMIPYEPPLASVLPAAEFEYLRKVHQEIYDIYRRNGIPPALGRLAKLTRGDQSITVSLVDFRKPYLFQNTLYWFEREVNVYPLIPFDIDNDFAPVKDKILFVAGEQSPRDSYQYQANEVMSRKLGKELVHLPGEHNGHVLNAKAFGRALLAALIRADPYYKQVQATPG